AGVAGVFVSAPFLHFFLHLRGAELTLSVGCLVAGPEPSPGDRPRFLPPQKASGEAFEAFPHKRYARVEGIMGESFKCFTRSGPTGQFLAIAFLLRGRARSRNPFPEAVFRTQSS